MVHKNRRIPDPTPGERFARLEVLEVIPGHPRKVRCRCDCGTVRDYLLRYVVRGLSRSCGCLSRDLTRERMAEINARPDHGTRVAAGIAASERAMAAHRKRAASPANMERLAAIQQDPGRRARASARWSTHGMSKHPLYRTWQAMLARCENPRHTFYHCYGARGISVCQDWHDCLSFISWIEANLGPRPERRSLDRIDNDGNYEPGNVRWATQSQQMSNRRPRGKAA